MPNKLLVESGADFTSRVIIGSGTLNVGCDNSRNALLFCPPLETCRPAHAKVREAVVNHLLRLVEITAVNHNRRADYLP